MPSLLPDGPIDTLGYLDALQAIPQGIEDALAAAPVHELVPATAVDHVVVVTDRAFVSAAEAVVAFAEPVSQIPVSAVGVGALPAHVGPRTLVLALGAADSAPAVAAAERGAHVVPIAAGGVPVARLEAVPLAVRALLVLEQLGLLAEVAESAAAAVTQLRDRIGKDLAGSGTGAKLARRVGRTLPIVHGIDAVGGSAARAWSRQVNQAAKVASFASSLDEVETSELAGWGQHGDMTRQVFTLLVLRHDHEPDDADERLRRAETLIDEVVHERHVVEAAGDGSLAQLLDLIVQGDLFAFHLAHELEIDPGPVAVWSEA